MAPTEHTAKIKKPASARSEVSARSPRKPSSAAQTKIRPAVSRSAAKATEEKSVVTQSSESAVLSHKEVSRAIAATPKNGFFRALGRRKEATARVRMTETGTGAITVNGRPFDKYFPLAITQESIVAPLKLTGQRDNHDYSVKVEGGGWRGQEGAMRHGLARVLLQWNPEFRPPLKKAGFLKRDPRAKERKKFGLKSARRAPQWAKR